MISSRNGFSLFSGIGPDRAGWVAGVLITLVIGLSYCNAPFGQWYFDDFPNIVDNPNVHANGLGVSDLAPSLHGMDVHGKSFSRPLAYLTFAINYAVGGDSPAGFLIVNIAIHLMSTLILFALVRGVLRLPSFRRKWGDMADSAALLTAVVWGTHPIHVNAVTYIVQRMASLTGLLVLAALGCYLLARTHPNRLRRWAYGAGCILSGTAALAVKENAALLPVNIILVEWLLIRGGRWGRRRHLVLGALGAVVLVAGMGVGFTSLTRLSYEYSLRPFTPVQRLLTEPRVLFFYLGQLGFPVSHQFTLLHSFAVSTSLVSPWTTLPALLGILGIAAIGIGLARRFSIASFAILFFLVNHLVESTFLPLELVFEHRNYIPSMFIFLPVILGFLHLLDRLAPSRIVQGLAWFGAACILAAQADTTFHRNRLFSDPVLLWEDNVAKAPDLHRPLHNLGTAYMHRGSVETGLKLLKQSLNTDTVSHIHQVYLTYFNLGEYYLHIGELDQAEGYLQQTIQLAPTHVKAIHSLGAVRLLQGKFDDAEALAHRAVKLAPTESKHWSLLGLIQLKQGHIMAARETALKTLRFGSGGAPDADYLLGEIARAENRLDVAERLFRRYSDQAPDKLVADLALIEIYAIQNDRDRLTKRVMTLLGKLNGRNLDAILTMHRRNVQLLDAERMNRIDHAIDQTLCDLPIGSNR